MKVFNFFFDFIVFCALLGASIWMLTDGNYVFGALVLVMAIVAAYRNVKRMNKGEYDR